MLNMKVYGYRMVVGSIFAAIVASGCSAEGATR